MINVDTTTATTISLSWTSAGSVVDSYASGDCLDEDDGSTILTDGSTSYNITELEEYSNYTITVMAVSNVENATTNTITATTGEAGIYLLQISQ